MFTYLICEPTECPFIFPQHDHEEDAEHDSHARTIAEASQQEAGSLEAAVEQDMLPLALVWLTRAAACDPGMHVAFHPSLTKTQRAVVHRYSSSDWMWQEDAWKLKGLCCLPLRNGCTCVLLSRLLFCSLPLSGLWSTGSPSILRPGPQGQVMTERLVSGQEELRLERKSPHSLQLSCYGADKQGIVINQRNLVIQWPVLWSMRQDNTGIRSLHDQNVLAHAWVCRMVQEEHRLQARRLYRIFKDAPQVAGILHGMSVDELSEYIANGTFTGDCTMQSTRLHSVHAF